MNPFLLDTMIAVLSIGSCAAAAIALQIWAHARLSSVFGAFYPIVAIVLTLLSFGIIASVLLRLLRKLMPLQEGEFHMRTSAFTRWKADFNLCEAAYRSLAIFLPVTARAWLFRLLGASIESPVLVAGTLTDPSLTRIGVRSIIGANATIVCHSLVKERAYIRRVLIGRYVTIGGGAIVMPGVEIGDDAVISPGSVVLANTRVPAGELWAGNPARKAGNAVTKS